MLLPYEVEICEEGINVTVFRNTLLMPGVTPAQMRSGYARYYGKAMKIQDAYNFLDDTQREFLMSGLLPEQWDELFPEESANEST